MFLIFIMPRMTNTFITHISFVLNHWTHPMHELLCKVTGAVAIDLVTWIVYRAQLLSLRITSLSKTMTEECLLSTILWLHVAVNMVQHTLPRGRKHIRHRHKLFRSRKMFFDKCCPFSYLQFSSEYRWQVTCMPSGYKLDKVEDAHRKMMTRCHDLFTIPHEDIRVRTKKPPDRLIILVCTLIWITAFHLLHVLIGIGRIMAIISRKKWNRWRT